MARLKRLESRASLQVVAGAMSVMLHVGLLFLLAFPGGRQLGVDDRDDAPSADLVMLQDLAPAPRVARSYAQWMPAVLATNPRQQMQVQVVEPPAVVLPDPGDETEPSNSVPQLTLAAIDEDARLDSPAAEGAPVIAIPKQEASALLRRIERLARKKLPTKPRARTTWSEDGKQYVARLELERARDGLEADRVIAEVTAESEGKRLMTRLMLRRLTYSQFAQIIDHWDPMVQLHDDEVVGPTHINSRFNILSDAEARPALRGKVSTAAFGFNMRSTAGASESDVFRGGIKTGVGRITLSDQVDPAPWELGGGGVRVHEIATDTHIQFHADGSYSWTADVPGAQRQRGEPTATPVYFIAAPGVTLAVQGTVAGKVLVYSRQGIVVAGSLKYAHDPRTAPDSDDYLGLVSDRDIEVAPPPVTGPGDVSIDAALFARRRFVVTEFDHRPSATLRIYGSLAAGSVTASEPRYAMKIEYDRRFDRRRPPGFPSMNRYATDDWDRRWTELPAQAATGAL